MLYQPYIEDVTTIQIIYLHIEFCMSAIYLFDIS